MLIDVYLTVLPVSSLGATTKKVLNNFIHVIIVISVISVISFQPIAYVGETGKTKSKMNVRLILFKDEDGLFQNKTNCQCASAGFDQHITIFSSEGVKELKNETSCF